MYSGMAKFDLVLSSPIMNAAGSLGYSPNQRLPIDWDRMGCFVTNPISLLPRKPAQGYRCLTFPGGFLLHTGYPNPGLKSVLRKYKSGWARSALPVIVNILCRSVIEVEEIVKHIEDVPGIIGIEVNLSPETEVDLAGAFVRAAGGELPVVMRLPLNRALELGGALIGSDAAAYSLAPPRGVLRGPGGGFVEGRLYGPAMFPIVFGVVQKLVKLGMPVFAGGGVYSRNHVDQLINAGASGVQLDSVLWKGGYWKKAGQTG